MATKAQAQKARYGSWKPALADFVVSVGLCAILVWIGPDIYNFLAQIPDPGQEIIYQHSIEAVSWWEVFFSLRTLGLVIFLAVVYVMWRNRKNFTLLRGLRWSAFVLIVINLLLTGKPTVIEEAPLLVVWKFSMTLYRVISRQAIVGIASLGVMLILGAIALKNLQLFLLSVQTGEFLFLEGVSVFVFNRGDLVILSAVGAIASSLHLQALLPEDGSRLDYWIAAMFAAGLFLGVNVLAFYLLTWPHLAKVGIIVLP